MVTVILAVVCFGLLLALPTHASHAPHSDAFGQSYSASKAQTVISLGNVKDWTHGPKLCCEGCGCHTSEVSLGWSITWPSSLHSTFGLRQTTELIGKTLPPLTGPPRS